MKIEGRAKELRIAMGIVTLLLLQPVAFAKKKPNKQPIPIYQGTLEDIKVGQELVGFTTTSHAQTNGQASLSGSINAGGSFDADENIELQTTTSAVSSGIVRYYRWYAILSGGLLIIGRERIHTFPPNSLAGLLTRSKINAGDFIAGQIVAFGWDRVKGKMYLPGMKHNHPLTVYEQRAIPGLPNPLGIRVTAQQLKKATE